MAKDDQERRAALRAAVHSAVEQVTKKPKLNRQQKRALVRRASKKQSAAQEKHQRMEDDLKQIRRERSKVITEGTGYNLPDLNDNYPDSAI